MLLAAEDRRKEDEDDQGSCKPKLKLWSTGSKGARVSGKFYAVRRGRAVGVYKDWNSCKEQVHRYREAEYKSFGSTEEAIGFMSGKVLMSSVVEMLSCRNSNCSGDIRILLSLAIW